MASILNFGQKILEFFFLKIILKLNYRNISNDEFKIKTKIVQKPGSLNLMALPRWMKFKVFYKSIISKNDIKIEFSKFHSLKPHFHPKKRIIFVVKIWTEMSERTFYKKPLWILTLILLLIF